MRDTPAQRSRSCASSWSAMTVQSHRGQRDSERLATLDDNHVRRFSADESRWYALGLPIAARSHRRVAASTLHTSSRDPGLGERISAQVAVSTVRPHAELAKAGPHTV